MNRIRWIGVLGLVVLFIGTGSETGITGKDEYWVTLRTPLEMIEDHSFWTLRLNDEVRLQKPPLIYWLIAAGYQTLGVHLWVARLIGVLSGAGMAVLTAKMYRRLFGGSGVSAGLLLLATAGVAVEGRRAMLDLPLGFFCLGSVYFALAAWQDQKPWKWTGSGVLLAAATMSKGPQSLVFVIPGLVLGAFLVRPRPSPAKLLSHTAAVGIPFLVLALPWPLSMRSLHADFIAELQTQIVDNRIGAWDPSSPLNALGGALLLVFPWSFVLLTGLCRCTMPSWRNRKRLWLCGWLLLSLAPFFFIRAFERYMIPTLPCASLLIVQTLETCSPGVRHRLLLLSASLLALVSVLFSLFGLWFHLSIWAAVLTLSLTGLLLHTAATCPNVQRTFAFTALVFTTLLGILYPRFGINRFPADLPWEELHQQRVGVYGNYSQPAMLSMRLERSVEFPFEARLNQHGFDGYLFTTQDQFIDPDPTDDRVAFLDHALRTAGIPWEEAGSYPVLFSRRNWIRFTRPDAEWADWVQALKNRDLKNLKSEIVFVRAGSAVKDSHK